MRFSIVKEEDGLSVVDSTDKIIFTKKFHSDDYYSLLEVIDHLNELSELFMRLSSIHIKCNDELFLLKAKISSTIESEIEDCKLLIESDPNDIYAQGRLVELHNLVKILL